MNDNSSSPQWLKPKLDILKQVFSDYGKVFVNWTGNKIPCTTNGYCEIFPDGSPYYGKTDPRYKTDDPNRKTPKDFEFWSTLDEAIAACNANPKINGVGIRLGKFLNTVCIDLDDVDDVMTDARVKALMAMFPSYTEISTSGHGIHIFLKGSKGSITQSRKVVNLGDINTELEVYDSDRYMITTGHAISAVREITDCQDALNKLLEQFREDAEENTVIEAASSEEESVSPDEILQRLKEISKIAPLVSFDKSALKKYYGVNDYDQGDMSSMDMTLMNEIAYLTSDYNKAVEAFKKTDLYARRLQVDYKKANRADYFERTFNSAREYINKHPRIDSQFCANDKDILWLKDNLINDELTDFKFMEYLNSKALFRNVRVMLDMQSKFVKYDDSIGCWDFNNVSDSLVRPIVMKEIMRLVTIIKKKYDGDLTVNPIITYLTAKLNKRGCEDILAWIRKTPELQMRQSEFEQPERVANFINFVDKKLNLETVQFEDNDPEDYSSKSCDIRVLDYLDENGQIKHDNVVKEYIHNFFTPTFGPDAGIFDDELYDYFLRALGASLRGSIKDKAVFFLCGPANTGKSVLMDCLGYALNLLGGRRKYFSHLESSFFTVDRKGGNNDALVDLQGVRIARISEMSTDDKMLNEFIKNITGNDVLTGSRKYENAVTFRNMVTVWVETNEMPTAKNGADNAFFNRIKCIDCKHIVEPGQQDKELRTKLQNDQGGWLWLFVEAAKAYRDHGLQDCQKVIDSVKHYRTQSSNVLKFAELYLEVTGEPRDYIASGLIYDRFKEFLVDEQGSDAYAGCIETLVKNIIAPNAGKLTSGRKYINGKQTRIIKGLRFKEIDDIPANSIGVAKDFDSDAIPYDAIPF